jgi:DNA (cytosine-5)-methyltransferase 1
MKSSNPNSGCREVDLSKTLDTAALNPSANQGGIAIYSIREDAKADNFSATTTDTSLALQSLQPSPQSHHAQIFIADPEPTAVVRRLTPTECERLQGFPDGWTDGQADSHRYKQMGNAVTVNVIEWIGAQL